MQRHIRWGLALFFCAFFIIPLLTHGPAWSNPQDVDGPACPERPAWSQSALKPGAGGSDIPAVRTITSGLQVQVRTVFNSNTGTTHYITTIGSGAAKSTYIYTVRSVLPNYWIYEPTKIEAFDPWKVFNVKPYSGSAMAGPATDPAPNHLDWPDPLKLLEEYND